MNVLLIGGSGGLIDQIMIKLKKEGHRIFLLTGNKYAKHKYEKYFERYNLTYDCEFLTDIFESVHPDVTLFMGAFDTNFTWMDERRDAVHYASGMMNLLAAYAVKAYGRFIYLSSSDVFDGDYPEDIEEEQAHSATRFRGMAIAQGEDLCDSYRKSCKADIVTLRLDHIFYLPKNAKEINDMCGEMCLKAIKEQPIRVNMEHRFSTIYVSDAVEYIYRLIACERHFYPLYHLTSGQEISEHDLAMWIDKAVDTPLLVQEIHDWNAREVLSNRRFEEEFGLRVFHRTEEVVPKIISQILQKKKAFLADDRKKKTLKGRVEEKLGWLVGILLPFIENVICFVPFFMLNNRAVGSEYFDRLDFYLIYVLLFAIVYGQQQAIVSAVLAVIGYTFRQMYQRTGFDVLMDYNTYVWIAQLFVIGLVVGYMRDQIRSMKSENVEEQHFLNDKLYDMTEINQSNVRVKDSLEKQIVNQTDSIGKIYNITSQLDRYMPEEVLFYAAEMLSKLMNSKDVAIYSVSNYDYARLASATSKKARQYGFSVKYREMKDIVECLESKKVYINRNLDERYPHMVSGLYEEDKLQMLVMVWGIPWEQMTLGQANMLTVISALTQNAVLRANRYMEALEAKRYVAGSPLMETSAFTTLVQAFLRARDRGLTECALLEVEAKPEQYQTMAKEASQKLRKSDYVGTMENGSLCILLSNSDNNATNIVINRLSEIGIQSEVMEEIKA